MYQGTYVKRRRKSRTCMNRATVLLMAILMLIGVVAGSTFEYAKVSCEVTENFDKDTKSNVQVKNTGTTDAYIRATYVINWLDKDGNIAASVPTGYRYELKENPDSKWTEGSDGYFYYPTPVGPGESTEESLLTCKVTYPENPEYTLSVEILATAVQSQPASAVIEAWGANTPLSGN